MRFAAALSTNPSLAEACTEAALAARQQLEGDRVDLCVVFVAANYPEPERSAVLLADAVDPRCLVGCTGGGILGAGREIEGRPAVSVVLARLPGVTLHAAHWTDADLPSADAPPSAWSAGLGMAAAEAKGILVLPEPFSCAADKLLAGLDYAYPGVPKIGGIASGSRQPGGHVLFLGRQAHHGGAVLLGFSGRVVLDTVVAQGCRPFGKPGRITQAENHYLVAVDGKPALAFLHEQLQSLSPADQELVRGSPVFLGIGADPFAGQPPAAGEFLIRNLLGYDKKTGMVTVGEMLSVGRIVQFHLRSAAASSEDLRQMLTRRLDAQPGTSWPRGALLFSCLGRGEHLYGEPDHDSRLFFDLAGQVALGGFFCNGEIGPVAGTTYLHGYTSSFGIFREPAG